MSTFYASQTLKYRQCRLGGAYFSFSSQGDNNFWPVGENVVGIIGIVFFVSQVQPANNVASTKRYRKSLRHYVGSVGNVHDNRAEVAIRWIRAHGGRCTNCQLVKYKVAGVRKSSEAAELIRGLVDRGLGDVETVKAANGKAVLYFKTSGGNLTVASDWIDRLADEFEKLNGLATPEPWLPGPDYMDGPDGLPFLRACDRYGKPTDTFPSDASAANFELIALVRTSFGPLIREVQKLRGEHNHAD